MALGTGANVLALTVLEASVVNESLDSNRNALNAQILRHKEDRL